LGNGKHKKYIKAIVIHRNMIYLIFILWGVWQPTRRKKGRLQSCLCCEKSWEKKIVKKVTKGVGGWGSEGHGTSPTLQMKDR
jgi:hypothetical protein